MSENINERTERLRALRDEVIARDDLPLASFRKENGYHPVLGEGNHAADLMFIGEAPGENEAKQGRPFCGAAGRVLDELIDSIELSRQDVYVTNILKDRPPQNRDPNQEEIEAYTPILDKQIEIIQPKVIATLGRYAMEYIFDHLDVWEKLKPISQMHGEAFEAPAPYGTIWLVPLYHPAAALYNPSTKQSMKDDFQVLKKILEGMQSEEKLPETEK